MITDTWVLKPRASPPGALASPVATKETLMVLFMACGGTPPANAGATRVATAVATTATCVKRIDHPPIQDNKSITMICSFFKHGCDVDHESCRCGPLARQTDQASAAIRCDMVGFRRAPPQRV